MTKTIATTAPQVMAPAVEVHLAEQVRLTTEIIHMMVGIDVELAEVPWPPQDNIVASLVRFEGAWAGAMIFECTVQLAFEFTARFMGIAVPMTIDDDVCDSLGELANMIAGNFKSLLPHGTNLSLPKVHTETTATHSPTQGAVLGQTVFQTSFGECCVKLEGEHPQQ